MNIARLPHYRLVARPGVPHLVKREVLTQPAAKLPPACHTTGWLPDRVQLRSWSQPTQFPSRKARHFDTASSQAAGLGTSRTTALKVQSLVKNEMQQVKQGHESRQIRDIPPNMRLAVAQGHGVIQQTLLSFLVMR